MSWRAFTPVKLCLHILRQQAGAAACTTMPLQQLHNCFLQLVRVHDVLPCLCEVILEVPAPYDCHQPDCSIPELPAALVMFRFHKTLIPTMLRLA